MRWSRGFGGASLGYSDEQLGGSDGEDGDGAESKRLRLSWPWEMANRDGAEIPLCKR